MIIQGADSVRKPSFSFMNRVRRQIWNIAWMLLFRVSPRPFHRWRTTLLSIFGAKIGKDCHIYPAVKIWAPWNLNIGNYVGIGDGVNLYSMALISIGDWSVISQGAHLCSGTHDYNTLNFQLVARPISIGTHVWVCADTFIHPGVVMPDGAVVGARSVVIKSLAQAWGVYAGNPCKQIGMRKILKK